MSCYQCVGLCGRVTGVTGKLIGGRFYGVRLTMQRARYSLVMKEIRALERL